MYSHHRESLANGLSRAVGHERPFSIVGTGCARRSQKIGHTFWRCPILLLQQDVKDLRDLSIKDSDSTLELIQSPLV